MVAPARIGNDTFDFGEDAAAKPVERDRVKLAQDLPIRLCDVTRHDSASASCTASLEPSRCFRFIATPESNKRRCFQSDVLHLISLGAMESHGGDDECDAGDLGERRDLPQDENTDRRRGRRQEREEEREARPL